MKHPTDRNPRPWSGRARRLGALALLIAGALSAVPGATAAPPVVGLSQVPLTISVPANPQIVFAIANSQSMDGNLSGAIMTGSGSLGAGYAQLNSSSSPVSYTIPAGFTPPVDPGAGGVAPYTSSVGGNFVDNSPSRLNMAKAGITAVLNTYMQSADFALIDYNITTPWNYQTWVYEMSTAAGFSFTNLPAATDRVIPNPCFNYAAGTSVTTACNNLATFFAPQNVAGSQFMVIGASSDDPSINDVLYAGGLDPVCTVYGGPAPANPYPPHYTLANYNFGGVFEFYSQEEGSCAQWTGPTNAGFVPYAPQTFYEQRGYGFYTFWESAVDGTVQVPMTSAGATPTTASINTALAAFAPLLAPETSSTWTTEIKAAATQSPTAGLLSASLNYYVNGKPPSSNGCNPNRYVVLVTDGLPTMDLNARYWPPLGSAAAAGYGVTATFNADGSLNVTNDQALIDAIAQLTALEAAGIKTYIIGLGAGVDPTKNPTAAATLKAMAVAGGTGNYFPATSAVALTNDMQVILAAILAQTQATSSAAVNSTGLRNGSVVYQSQFLTSDSNLDWTGELFAFPINPSTGAVNTAPAAANWSAKTQLDLQSWDVGRVIATYDPGTRAGTPFRWNAALAPNGISAATPLGLALGTFAADPNGQDVLLFLRGKNAQEQRFGGVFRNRTHKLGDIVDSSPLYVGTSSGPSRDPAYMAFAASTAARPAVIYVGANDGMLHAFDALTGNERFAFIPNGVWNNLVKLANPYYNQQHRYFVNGSPQASDVKFADNSWHTVLVGNEGAGGQTLFALDITHPDQLTTETLLSQAVLWEFTDVDMGYSFSEPAIDHTNAGYLAIFGNGYDSVASKAVLYAVNAQTGATVAKLDLCTKVAAVCNAALANGLSSVTVVNSSGQISQAADTVYAGDLQGNLWRINISNANPANWVVTVLLQAKDPLGVPQPITTAPAATLNPRYPKLLGTMVFVGTGQLLGAGDLSTTQLQSIYGVYDAPAGYASPLTRANLVQQTLTNGAIGTVAVRYATSNPVNLPAQNGWFIDLNLLSGERVVTDPSIYFSELVLTTYQPTGSVCLGGGAAYLMVLNYATGGSFPTPQFDVNGDNQLTAADTGAGGNPVAMSLGNVYAAAPVILSSATGSFALTVTSDTKDNSTKLKGGSQSRIAWWEVR